MLGPRIMRVVRGGADAEGGAKQKSPYAQVHALKTRRDADQFLESALPARLRY
jgi:hypothetical protein